MTMTPLTFLEASRLLAGFGGGPSLSFKLCLSGAAAQLELFLRAEAARQGVALTVSTLAFGTLRQHLFTSVAPEGPELFLLYPWDVVAALNWRTGVSAAPVSPGEARAEAAAVLDQVLARCPLAVLYLPAPLPPSGLAPADTAALALELRAVAAARGVKELPADLFALGAYLASGCPLTGPRLGAAAQAIIAAALAPALEPKKVLVTDLDNTLWSGIIGEEGLEGISAAPEGAGFRHYLYQTLLRKLKVAGILLAVVSRNDAATVARALAPGRMVLAESDFVAVLASYNPKSVQIAELARRLNLGLAQFVFVDDNPVELEEVRGALPEVECLTFPPEENGLLALFERLHHLFRATAITAEDRQRTDHYRRMVAGTAPVGGSAHDLSAFLAGLTMILTVHDRSHGDRTRAVQLINKTNQFNLNGRRWDDAEVEVLLAAGGQLYTAALADRIGEHGEILSLLLDGEGTVQAFVLSCRVFQRRVEHAFLLWLLLELEPHRLRFHAQRTEYNEPLWQFLTDAAFRSCGDGDYALDEVVFRQRHGTTLGLFRLVSPPLTQDASNV